MNQSETLTTDDCHEAIMGAIALVDFLLDPPVWDEENLAKLKEDFDEEFIENMRDEYESDVDIEEVLIHLKAIWKQAHWFDWIDWLEAQYPAMNLDALCALKPSMKAFRNELLSRNLTPLEVVVRELEEHLAEDTDSENESNTDTNDNGSQEN